MRLKRNCRTRKPALLSVGKEGVSAADALDARSAAYQAGKSYVGRKNELFQPEAWREGENSQGFREKGGSAITSSEMRHAIRMGENSTVHFVGGAEI